MPYFEVSLKWDIFAEAKDEEDAKKLVEERVRSMTTKGDWALSGGLRIEEVHRLFFAPSAVATR